jgi:5,10-methylenetetrahydromethanopterin reductase
VAVSFQIGILPDRPIAEIADLAAYAEDLGFSGIWIADSQSIFRDAFDALTLCATKTRTLRLATGVTNPITRHLAALAGSLATIDELSGGRAVAGIGVGESAVQTLGLRPARLSELEQATRTLRLLLAGEEVEHDGSTIRLTWSKREVPIFWASSGPRSLQAAGRVADGVLFQVGADPALVRYGLDLIEAGAAGRPVTKYIRLACAVGADRDAVRSGVRSYAAVAAGTVYANVPHDVIPPDVLDDIRLMKEQYDYYEHGSATAQHRALVTDRVLDTVAVAGAPDEVAARFRALIELGVDGFVLPITSADPRETLRILAEDVIAHL